MYELLNVMAMPKSLSKKILYLGLDPANYSAQGQITHWPIIQIIPRPLSEPSVQESIKNFECYSHVIVTSKSTVAILKNYLCEMRIDLRVWSEKLTLAVGQTTAQHLRHCGIDRIKVAENETAEGVIDELKQLPLHQGHVFWPHSAQARPLIKDYLMAQKICHTTCVFYEPQVRNHSTLPALENFDEIVFTSPSTVDAFLHIFGSFPSHAQLVPIGPITANFLQKKFGKC